MNLRWLIVVPLIAFLGLAVLFYTSLGADKETLPSALIGKPLPEFSLSDLATGEPLGKATLLGEPALLNVWATWCISCRVEHPMLNRLSEAGVKIIGLNYKDHNGKANDWLDKYGNPYSLTIFDPDGRLGFDLGVYGAPETYLLDENGQIRAKHVGVIDENVWQGDFGNAYRQLFVNTTQEPQS